MAKPQPNYIIKDPFLDPFIVKVTSTGSFEIFRVTPEGNEKFVSSVQEISGIVLVIARLKIATEVQVVTLNAFFENYKQIIIKIKAICNIDTDIEQINMSKLRIEKLEQEIRTLNNKVAELSKKKKR